jgi:hypothetical protein
MTDVVEGIEGPYELHHTPYGKSYVWSSECIVEECGCGQGLVLSSTAAICRCGADQTVLIRKEQLPNSR